MSDLKKEGTHVDDFVMDYTDDKSVMYAKWFLFLKRLPATEQAHFDEWIKEYRLFATWKGKRYRVTGASRLGDVWLAKNFNQDHGYDHRVSVDELTEFGNASGLSCAELEKRGKR